MQQKLEEAASQAAAKAAKRGSYGPRVMWMWRSVLSIRSHLDPLEAGEAKSEAGKEKLLYFRKVGQPSARHVEHVEAMAHLPRMTASRTSGPR